MREFLIELRRRNVVKVATVYVVVGWGVIQAADVLFPALTLPKWTVTLVVALVIAGFPISLMLAWAFELTPSGIARENREAVSADRSWQRSIDGSNLRRSQSVLENSGGPRTAVARRSPVRGYEPRT